MNIFRGVVMYRLYILRDARTHNRNILEFFLTVRREEASDPPWQRACVQQKPV